MKQAIAVFLISSAVLLIFTIAQPAQAQTFNTQLNINLLSQLPQPVTTDPPGDFKHVQPADFDPGKTNLVQATWLSGIGCPTNAKIALPNMSFTGIGGFSSYTDPACPNTPGAFDPNDHHNDGLLLAKTGPTSSSVSQNSERKRGLPLSSFSLSAFPVVC